MVRNKIRLLKAHGTTVKLTAVSGNDRYNNDIIRIQAANGDDGFFKGPEIPVDHLSAFIGHLQDLKESLEKTQPEYFEKSQKEQKNPNAFTYDDEIPNF
jgi:hypothetical protein